MANTAGQWHALIDCFGQHRSNERFRYRCVNIFYVVEDGSVKVSERKTQNAGPYQIFTRTPSTKLFYMDLFFFFCNSYLISQSQRLIWAPFCAFRGQACRRACS